MSKLILSALVLCATSSSAFATVLVSSTPFALAAPANTNVLIDFDSAIPNNFSLTGGVIQSNSNGIGAEPAGDTSKYLTANSNNPATLLSTTGYNTVSFYWGSMDSYNTITLLDKNGNAIQSFTGLSVFTPANGDQSAGATNRRVTFTTTGGTSAIYGLEFQSGAPAFEVDNIAFTSPVPIGAVPESSSWAMMIGGLGMVGSSLRRSKKAGARKLAPA